MYLALRDLRFARGRFALVATVIALISLLVVLLSGLTAGLADESVSALRRLPVDRLAMAAGDGGPVSFSASRLDAATVDAVVRAAGPGDAAPLGVAASRLGLGPGGEELAVTVFGAEPGAFVAPTGLAAAHLVAGPELLADAGLAPGDEVLLEGRPLALRAAPVDASFNHTPVVWVALDEWQALDAAAGAAATAVALAGPADGEPLDLGAAGTALTVLARDDAFAAVGSFSAENGSLRLMRGLLLVVGALVVGSFFTVWTMQRMPDLAVLKAIGASSGYLLRDAAVQALLLLAAGGLVGTAVAIGVGALAARSVPFVLAPETTLVPLATLLAVGMLGALASVRRISSVDPLAALSAAR